MSTEILELTTTTETEDQARGLAKQLVEQRLAACVQIVGPIESFYRWQGELCSGNEYRLTVKSTLAQEHKLLDFIEENHPYDVPEILLQHFATSEAYGQWLRQQVG